MVRLIAPVTSVPLPTVSLVTTLDAITLSATENSVLSLGPSCSLPQNSTPLDFTADLEKAIFSVRWQKHIHHFKSPSVQKVPFTAHKDIPF